MKPEELEGMIVNIHEGQVINVVNADRNKRIVVWSVFVFITVMLSWHQGLLKPNLNDSNIVNVNVSGNSDAMIENPESTLLD